MTRARITAAALAAILAAPLPVWAGQQEAIQYYNQALAAYQKGDLDEALQLLRRAHAEDPNLIYIYNQILVLRGLERYQEALDLLVLYENPMKEDPENRFSDVAAVRQSLEEALARQPAGALVEAPPIEAPPLEEDPVASPQEVDPKGIAPPILPPPGSVGGEPDEEGIDWLGWTLTGAGALVTGAGLLLASGVFVSDQRTRLNCATDSFVNDPDDPRFDFSQPCFQDEAFDPYRPAGSDEPTDYYGQHDADLETFDDHTLAAYVTLGSGIALTAAGVILLLIRDDDERTVITEDGFEEARRTRPTLLPYADSRGAGAVLRFQF